MITIIQKLFENCYRRRGLGSQGKAFLGITNGMLSENSRRFIAGSGQLCGPYAKIKLMTKLFLTLLFNKATDLSLNKLD